MRVLVVDDERPVRDSIKRALDLEGFKVQLAHDGESALKQIAATEFDVVVLDIMMPGLSGLDVCRRLRLEGNRVPILMLTARDAVRDRVAGLDAGADDYLVKPFALDELLARIRALIRRSTANGGSKGVLRYSDLTLDQDSYQVHRGERLIELSRTEFLLLELLLLNKEKVLSRDVVFERVWGYNFGAQSNSIDVYIGYLRRKTEAGGEPRLIQTVRGVGYVLRESS